MIANHLGCDLSEIAYIGDSSGDIGLKIVRLPFAPSNVCRFCKAGSSCFNWEINTWSTSSLSFNY